MPLGRFSGDAGAGGGEGGGEGGGAGGAAAAGGASLVACGAECTLVVSERGECYVWGSGEHGRLGLGDNDAEHEAPQRLAALSHPAMRVQAAACGRGVGSLDEGPTMLVLASPESMDEFSAQFLRYYV